MPEGPLEILGEVEAVFGIWAIVFLGGWAIGGVSAAAPLSYLNRQSFAEPIFVFCIMLVAGSRPVISVAEAGLGLFARLVPLPAQMGRLFSLLFIGPLLGSLITEPAAMTVVAMLLKSWFFDRAGSRAFKYALVACLFVNVSIGGVLTAYAAPPVLMVAEKFGWDTPFMFLEFGWRAIAAVATNAFLLVAAFRKEILRLPETARNASRASPLWLSGVHLALLAGVVLLAHETRAMVGVFLLFVGVVHGTRRHQAALRYRDAMMVAFFLAGLVCLGGTQGWWLSPLLSSLGADPLFYGTTLLTAVTDNAALTYLGAQVPGLSEIAKEALVAGAVTGGGLTLIANAPNPAGMTILESGFERDGFSSGRLLIAAAVPTVVAVFWFWWV